MDGDEIGLFEQVVELPEFYIQALGQVLRHEGVVGEDPHLESIGSAGHLGAYLAQPDNPQRFASKLGADEPFPGPFAGLEGRVGLGDVPGQRKHQRHGVLSGGYDVGGRRVDDNHASLCCGINVDVVNADTGAANNLQVRSRFQSLSRDLRLATDDKGVVLR